MSIFNYQQKHWNLWSVQQQKKNLLFKSYLRNLLLDNNKIYNRNIKLFWLTYRWDFFIKNLIEHRQWTEKWIYF